jgi:UDP-GlcNAc:undecaprenyl-phosphate GlcNAc-1-phosphate transferase
MREYLLVLLVAAGVTYLLAGLCRSVAVRTGMLAPVRSRDVHTFPIPYLGGVAMLGGLAVAFLLALEMPCCGRASSSAWSGCSTTSTTFPPG